MPKLTIIDFNTPEYYGIGGNMLGGYGKYLAHRASYGPGGLDEFQYQAQRFIERGGLVGRTVIDLGCGFGSLVYWLNQQGADAWGLDLSYPISQAQVLWPAIANKFIVADARIWVPAQAKNSWDGVISRGFLDCLTDTELEAIIPELNRICKFLQVHAVDPSNDPEYYNQKTLAEWQALPWEPGTIIVDEAN